MDRYAIAAAWRHHWTKNGLVRCTFTPNGSGSGSGDACAYWNQQGNRCAIGALLPVDMARSCRYVQGNLADLVHAREDIRQYLVDTYGAEGVEDWKALGDLQRIHDRQAPDEWSDALSCWVS